MKPKAIQKNVLLGLTLSLVMISCASPCKKIDWTPDVYVANNQQQNLINSKGLTVGYENMFCFDPQNMAELKAEIERIGRKETMLKAFLRTYPKQDPTPP